MKLLNFENCVMAGCQKLGYILVKIDLTIKVIKKCAPKFVFSND